LWAHGQWDNGGVTTSIENLYREFEKENIEPWYIIDEIMEGIHQQGGGKGISNFRITNPCAEPLR
jgi:hypothetical protein